MFGILRLYQRYDIGTAIAEVKRLHCASVNY